MWWTARVRILHVNKFVHRRGGAESYLLDLADLQRRDGHEVQVWGMRHPEDPPDLPLADTFASFVELDPAPSGAAGLRAAARMVWSREAASRLAQAVRRFGPDAVHFHNVYHQLSPSVLAPSVRGGVPAVLTLHDYKVACPSYQMLDHGRPCRACVDHGALQAARRRCKGGSLPASALLSVESGLHRLTGAWGRVDALVSPSRFLAGVVRDAGVDHGRLHVVPHFVDPPPSAGAPRAGAGPVRRRRAAVGREGGRHRCPRGRDAARRPPRRGGRRARARRARAAGRRRWPRDGCASSAGSPARAWPTCCAAPSRPSSRPAGTRTSR